MCIGVAHFGDAVYNIVVRIPRVFLKVADCAEEVALSVIVLIFHFALIGDCRVVAPCAYKHHVFLAGSGDAECHCTIGILHDAHLGHTAGICTRGRVGDIAYSVGLGHSLGTICCRSHGLEVVSAWDGHIILGGIGGSVGLATKAEGAVVEFYRARLGSIDRKRGLCLGCDDLGGGHGQRHLEAGLENIHKDIAAGGCLAFLVAIARAEYHGYLLHGL